MAASRVVSGIEDLASRVGERAGPTAWRSFPQELIDQFADITNDHQWIHVDVARAARESPFGGTVAHGDLTLSLLDGFSQELLRLDESGFLAGSTTIGTRSGFPPPSAPDHVSGRLVNRSKSQRLAAAGGG